MAKPLLARVAFVLCCWETLATAQVTKHVMLYYNHPIEVSLDETRQMATVSPPDIVGFVKYSTLYDYKTKMIAYKDLEKMECYLERMKDSEGGLKHKLRQIQTQSQVSKMRDNPRILYVSDNNLSKYEVWRLAGSRISGFCRGFPVTLLQQVIPQFHSGEVNNALHVEEELQLSQPPTGDAFLQRVRGRAKRQTTYTTRGYGRRYRGQTQTQYLAFQNGGNEGKAEAESSPELSRSQVSGTSGMGQAQSQSGDANGCEGCFPGGVIGYGYGYVPGAPPQPRAPTGVPGVGVPTVGAPTLGIPAVSVPAVGAPGVGVPGVGAPGVGPPTVGIPTGVPGVGVPGVGPPGVGVPGVGVPGVGPPGVGLPGVGVPGVGPPGVGVPGVGVPGVGLPGVGPPGVGVPGVGVPGVRPPGVGVPGVGVPGIGPPGVGVPTGVPGVAPGVPGVGVPGVGAPGVGVPGVGVPTGVPGVGVPGVGVPGIGPPTVPGVGVPIGVAGVGVPGLPGVAAPIAVPGIGVPGVPGVEAPRGIPGIGVGAPGVGVGVPGVGVGVGVGLGVGVGVGVGVPGVEAPRVGVPGVGVPGVTPVGIPSVGAPGLPGLALGVPGIGAPGVPGIGVPGVPGVGAPGVPGIGVPGVPGVGAPGVLGVTPVGVPSVGAPGVPGVGAPGVPGVGAPGVPGVGAPGVPGVGAPGVLGVGAPGVPGVTPVGVPTVGAPVGIPGVQIPGVGVPGAPITAVPSAGFPVQVVPGVGVPGGIPGGIPGAGVPGIGVPVAVPSVGVTGVGVPTGVPSVGVPGGLQLVGVPGGVPGVGVPGVPGVAAPPAGVYQPGPYQQPGIGVPGQVGYPGGIYQQLGGGVYTGQEAYYTAAGDSQAESSVRQEDKETRAAASAQGKYGGGTAQTQVSGIYSGTGAFSAQAQTSDKDRGAQSQVVGGKDGATSTAQGQAGSGKTQSQVQLGSSNGATTAEAQSGGIYYGANTQVQAGYQGGMADAQAKGQGSTSSQAQIGFTPYQENGTTNGQKSPFRGGGSASAQGGAYSGQSQSQIQGSFLHGISYTGAAQAGSGQTTYGRTASSNYEDFGGKLGLVQSGSRDGTPQNGGASTSTSQQTQYQPFGSLNNNAPSLHTSSQQQTHERGSRGQEVANVPHHSDYRRDYDETTTEPDAYTDTETRSQYRQTSNLGVNRNENESIQQGGYRTQTHGTRRNDTEHTRIPTQTQHIVLGPLNGRGAHIIQASDDQDQYSPGDILQPGQTIHGTPEYTIPQGYRGRITSVAGPRKTAAQGGQSQTVVITPGAGNVTYTNPSVGNYQPPVMSIPVGQQAGEGSYDQSSSSGHLGSGHTQLRNGRQQSLPVRWNGSHFSQRNGRTSRNGNQIRNGHSLNTYHHPTPDSFVTVTKSVTGQLDSGKASNNTGKYTHTYYTKSSTCGYFTFSCNIVFGSNGRTKICRPNPPTTPDGTPCCC